MKIADSIQYRGINQVYVIGGDGSQRGAGVIFEEVRKRGLKVVVAGIPKTIDNDIPGIWHLRVVPPLELVANRLWLRVKDDNLVLQGLWCINLVLCCTLGCAVVILALGSRFW